MKDIKTEKFTETTISTRWFVPLTRKDISAWNLLVMMLSRSTEAFPTRQAASKAAANAYGARCAYGLSAYGDCLKVEFRMSFLRENLVNEEGYTEQLVKLYEQYLWHPLFSEEILAECKYLLKGNLSAMSQDPDVRAFENAFASFTDQEALAVPMRGIPEYVDAATLDDVRALYERLMDTPCQTMICGVLSDVFAQYVRQHNPGEKITTTWSAPAKREEPARPLEEKEISQSSLVQVYTSGILPQDPNYYAFLVLNALLGSSSVSLLFEQVREQNSLCYSISTTLVRFAGLLVISTGADRSNLGKVEELIAQIIEQVKNKDVPEDTFEMVKAEMVDNMLGQNDSAMSMIEQEFLNEILDRPITLDQNIARLSAVTLDDVANAAKKLCLAVSSAVVQSESAMAQEEQYAA